jgi:glycosyltransferase involved in cell wall biosynthesis
VVIQEAFLHGRPVITSDIGGMAEKVRHNVSGLQFRAGSAESLVDRLVEALRNRGLWDRLHGRIPKPLGNIEAAHQHQALYRELLAGGGAIAADGRAAAELPGPRLVAVAE